MSTQHRPGPGPAPTVPVDAPASGGDGLRAGRVAPRLENPDGSPVERLHVAARVEDLSLIHI